jgi:hypothetical protein
VDSEWAVVVLSSCFLDLFVLLINVWKKKVAGGTDLGFSRIWPRCKQGAKAKGVCWMTKASREGFRGPNVNSERKYEDMKI